VLNPTVWISATVSRTIHVVGVRSLTVSNRDVTQVVVLGRVIAIIASIILGDVIWHGWRTDRYRSGDAAGGTEENPVVQWIVTMTVSDAMLAYMARVRIFFVGRSVFDVSGVEGEV
jgi:hypothetical protein